MKHLEKHSRQKELSFTPEDLRWATPEIAARYRAKRLSAHGKIIADLGCGIGFQTFAFAEKFEKVYAVEIDKEKIERAISNAKALGLKNIQFIHGDALDQEIIKQLKDADIIFCDPERLPTEEERTLEKITPNLHQLIALYSHITQNIAIELPPQIKNLAISGEKEYLSVEGKLNRLTIYCGKLAQAERSAVILSEEARLVAGAIVEATSKRGARLVAEGNLQAAARLESDKKAKLTFKNEIGKYLYEVDPAVVKAELVAELSRITKMSVFSKEKNTYLSSGKKVESPFFTHAFLVLAQGNFNDKEIISLLKKAEAGKVTLRFPLNPQEYWKIRMRYEKRLSGKKKVSLFKFGNEAIVGEELNKQVS